MNKIKFFRSTGLETLQFLVNGFLEELGDNYIVIKDIKYEAEFNSAMIWYEDNHPH